MRIILIILMISLFIISGCSKQNATGSTVQETNTLKTCDDVSLKASIVHINQEKKWVSIDLSNTGYIDINKVIIDILSDENLRAVVKKPLVVGEKRVETTNYGNMENDGLGIEVTPLINNNGKEILCKGLIVYKKLAQ